MIIIPLILCSVITGVARVGSGGSPGKLYGDTCCAVLVAKSEGETLKI
jgi:Na+/H+-dicarboxylate symporter